MARLTDAAGHTLLWNLERCEDTAVAAAFSIVSSKTRADWAEDFSVKFFGQGLALSDTHLRALNRSLRRCGLDALAIRETDASEYARRWFDYDGKIEHREEQRHRFAKASAGQRIEMLNHAVDQMARLLPPHMTLEQYRAVNPRNGKRGEAAALEMERNRRLAALEAAILRTKVEGPAQHKASLGIEQAIVLLRNTDNPALIDRIVGRLDTDAHIQIVASEHVPQALKDLLIDRILAT